MPHRGPQRIQALTQRHTATTLAEGFPLGKGIVRFELPDDLPSRDNYM
jgi:hypothetical protein